MIEKIEFGRKKMSVADSNRSSFRDLRVKMFHDSNQRSLDKF